MVDQNKDPVAGVPVRLIGREYYAGALRYFTDTGSATTNDRGEYVMRNVRAGRAMLLLMEKRKVYEGPISETPTDPKLRKPAYRATYYPSADSAGSAALIPCARASAAAGWTYRSCGRPAIAWMPR